MACTITILDLIVIESDGGNVTRAAINGTATECGSINVTLKCPRSENPAPASTNVNDDGTWAVEIEIDNAGCNCGGLFEVTAICEEDETCEAIPLRGTLRCPGLCPEIRLEEPEIGDCNDDGTRTVSFPFHIGNAGNADAVVAHWEFETDEEGNWIIDPPLIIVAEDDVLDDSRSHDFPTPGEYTPRLVIDLPQKCGSYPTERIELEECPKDCSEIEIQEITYQIADRCNADNRTRNITFDAITQGDIQEYEWIFGDGDSNDISPPVSHPYVVPRNDNTVTLIITGRNGCRISESIQIDVPACGSGEEFPDTGGGSGYGGDDDDRGGRYDGCLSVNCATLLYAAIFVFIIASILALIGCFVPPLLIVAIIAGIIAFILFSVWALICSRFTPCRVMQRIQCVLWFIDAVITPIVFIIFGGVFECPLVAAVIWGGWGTIRAWLEGIMRRVDCERRC